LATIRRVFRSAEPIIGLPGAAAPVFGSSRSSAPFSAVGSALVRTSCARSAPPSFVGSLHGFVGLPAGSCP
jgi:hypothetical protein